jgi:DNA-binding transcriptional regulator YiaG/uncharacterized phage-associated protein
MVFRKKEYMVNYHYYRDVDGDEQFTSGDLDEINLMQVYNQYRVEHKLPFPEEIASLRGSYGLSATKMAEVLGFGVNTYRNYEQGEVPSESNARLIQVAEDPEEFEKIVALCGVLKDTLLEKVRGRIRHMKEQRLAGRCIDLESYLMGSLLPDEFSGYRRPNLGRLVEMAAFFARSIRPWKTTMNKLLFYADFLHFKEYGLSLSGCRYSAIQLGPVPENFQSVFEYAEREGVLRVEEVPFSDGGIGERFSTGPGREWNASLFDEQALGIMERVSRRFRDMNTQEMVALSHQEPAWKDNQAARARISYRTYGFDLQAEI